MTVTLGIDTTTNQPVTLEDAVRSQGMTLIGKTGTGKTTLIEQLADQSIASGACTVVVDAHGDLAESLLQRIPPERADQVAFLDLTDTAYPVGINLFECADPTDPDQVAGVALDSRALFKKIWGPGSPDESWGPAMEDLIGNCGYLLASNPGSTLVEMDRLLVDEHLRDRLLANLRIPTVVSFWRNEYNRLRPNDQLDRRLSTTNKLRAFLTPTIANIVGQSCSTISVADIIAQRGILLVKLSRRQPEVASLVGRIIISRLANAIFARSELPPESRFPVHLFADEYQRYSSTDFAELLTEARKYGLATHVAFQFFNQIDQGNRGAVLNAGALVVMQVSGEDAEDLAREFDHTPPPPEVIGQTPDLALPADPLPLLVRGSAADPLQRGFIDQHLAPALEIRTERENKLAQYYAERATSAINQLLLAVMRAGSLAATPNVAPLLTDTVQALRSYSGLRGYIYLPNDLYGDPKFPLFVYCDDLLQGQDTTPITAAYVEAYHTKFCHPFEPGWWGEPATFAAQQALERYGQLQDPRHRSWAEQSFSQEQKQEAAAVFQEEAAKYNTKRETRWRESIAPGLNEDLQTLHTFVEGLIAVANAVASSPIQVETGRYLPRYGPTRTYADVQNEIASQLANLPPYHAKVKIRQGGALVEHTIKTQPLPPSEPGWAARAEQIREHSRHTYGRPRVEVEREIAERFGDDAPPERGRERL